jgi:hypothetical protein
MNVAHKMVGLYPAVASKDQYGGGKFIQEAMKHIKKGALTAEAKRHGEKPMEFAKEVLAHPGAHTETTRKRAQFAVNIQKRRK